MPKDTKRICNSKMLQWNEIKHLSKITSWVVNSFDLNFLSNLLN